MLFKIYLLPFDEFYQLGIFSTKRFLFRQALSQLFYLDLIGVTVQIASLGLAVSK